jgi:hypothetical protein
MTGTPPATIARSGSAALLGEATLRPSSTELTPFAGTSPDAWVIVRITGNFMAERNPACLAAEAGAPNWGCPTATGISSFTERLSYMGPVRVWRQSGTSKQQLQVRAGGGGGIALMHGRNAGMLSARVHLSVPSWQMPGKDPIPAYFISGEYTVTALEIPAPVELTESAGDGTGMRRYSLQPLHGLEFVNPTEPYYWAYRSTPNASWRFIPDRGTAKPVGDCDDKTVCTYKPAGAGEMEVTTYVEGQRVTVRSSGVPYVPPELVLDCGPNPVTRGGDLNCTVSSEPGGSLTDIAWLFRDDEGHDIPGPSALSWGGTMVIGGTVSVSARLDGAQLPEESQRVDVRARAWVDHLPPADVRYESCRLRTYTCPATELVKEMDTGVTFLPAEQIKINYRAYPIAEGPNAGWWYVAGTEPPITLPAPVTRLNPQLFDPNSRFYATRRTCRPVDVQYWITRHENVHVEIGQQRAREGWINGALESRMMYRPATDPRFNRETVDFIRERLSNLMDHRHTLRSRYPDAPTCIDLAA